MHKMTGMDIEQIRSMSRQMSVEARKIEDVVGSLSQRFVDSPWVGKDRDDFVEKWQTGHLNVLGKLVADLREASSRAGTHATDQEVASRAR